MRFEKFKQLELKKNELCSIKGGTSTTLVTEVGVWEEEYEDTNGNCELDEGDKYLGGVEFP